MTFSELLICSVPADPDLAYLKEGAMIATVLTIAGAILSYVFLSFLITFGFEPGAFLIALLLLFGTGFSFHRMISFFSRIKKLKRRNRNAQQSDGDHDLKPPKHELTAVILETFFSGIIAGSFWSVVGMLILITLYPGEFMAGILLGILIATAVSIFLTWLLLKMIRRWRKTKHDMGS